ncbi:hypothetical protein Poli38472_005398 [Pythium oligandrum]|uniref:Transmembrane protein n=1 Tax=Pythium oligandrum TaxID=41045 RepID=A0A8K1CHF3_PYTOL|nr:hypothetical protein Poli38472_005398 [Pythium oligandrum]|eukprot:TMW62780.1 hypothetical protein Poli38472_005398 [Pythium oligandrum]
MSNDAVHTPVRHGATSPQQRKTAKKTRTGSSSGEQLVKNVKEAYTHAVAELEKRAEACVDAVTEELEKWSLWAYRDQTGEEWDAQPACFITDYILAIQCFAFAGYLWWYVSTAEEGGPSPWYIIYFVALGLSAGFGGFLHHVAFEALRGIGDEKKKDLIKTARVFGVHWNRKTVDRVIETTWRIVLGMSILNNFALLSLALSRYLNEAWAFTVICFAGACYIALAVYASIKMHVIFLMAGYLPALVFGAVASVMAFNWEWSHSSNELLVYVLKLGSGLVQGLVVSPSHHTFNHNALSHVMLSVAATFMLVHSRL